MDDIVALAERLATQAHAGQYDKTGHPYIEHPARVAARVSDPMAKATAWLHDVVEHTAVTLHDLHAAGLPVEVVDAVQALTKIAGQDMRTYYDRVKGNPLAVQVKWADLADNTDPQRTVQLDPATRERLARKYATARELLTDV